MLTKPGIACCQPILCAPGGKNQLGLAHNGALSYLTFNQRADGGIDHESRLAESVLLMWKMRVRKILKGARGVDHVPYMTLLGS